MPFSLASVSLNLFERNIMRPDIDCPGDTISYNCSIQSNSETVHLMWSVTLPGSTPLSIIYDNTSVINSMDNLAMGVSTVLTQYRRDEYIESMIILNILGCNDSDLLCSIGDLESMSAYLSSVNSSGIQHII